MKKLLVLIAVAAVVAGCGGKNKTTDVEVDTSVLTKAQLAVETTVVLSEEYTSEIEPYKENDITPAVSGVHIDRILADIGSKVTQGQLLVSLDPTQYNQQLVQLKTIENDYNRLLPVFEAGGLSAQQIDQAKAQLDIQREIVANLKKNIEVRSPITGVVTARNAENGDLFMNQPILHVMQINPLKVIAHISEQYFPNIKQGMPVTLRLEAIPDMEFKGQVSLISPALDPATRTFMVEVKVPNDNERLRPGMYAQTTFNMGKKQGVMVPDVAIQKQFGSAERYLYVIKNGMAERRTVKLGRQVGDKVDVLSGVEVGDSVAVTALSALSDGAKVKIKQD